MERATGERSTPYSPTDFLTELSKLTKGSYYGLSLEKDVKESPEDWFYFTVPQ
jgi:hypothetical protein